MTTTTQRFILDETTANDLLAAARATLPALILLGDFIGNTFDGKIGIPAFDRCAVILELKRAIAKAEGLPGAGSVGDEG